MRRPFLVVVMAGALVGCGGQDPPGQPGTAGGGDGGSGASAGDPCPPPGRRVDGDCLDPGVADDGCPAGTTLVEGVCLAAGIPSDACGPGFTHDGDVACVPILPPAACAVDGEMAVPGDGACRAIMDCGTGQWGHIPVDSNTIYVDLAYSGGDGDGTAGKPFPIINQAIASAQGGELIAIAAGSYVEDVVVDRPVTLHGICPDQTEIHGDANSVYAALSFIVGSDGASVVGVTATETEPSPGIGLFGVKQVILDRVRVTGAGNWGVLVTHSEGVTSEVTIADSLIDQNVEYGVFVGGSVVTIEGTQIRDTAESSSGAGIGVEGLPLDGVAADLTLRRCLVEGGAVFGVSVIGSPVVLEDSVVRDIQPLSTDGTNGRGVNVQFDGSDQTRAAATIARSVITDNHGCGVFGASADLTIEHSVVAGTHPNVFGQGTGVAIQRSASALADGESQVEITGSVLEANEGTGIFVSKSHAVLERAVVRDTLPDVDGAFGRGVYLRIDDQSPNPVATMTLLGSVVDHNTDVGVFVAGAELTMTSTVVSATQPDNDGPGGRGISIQPQSILGTPALVSIVSSVIEDNVDHGIHVGGSEITIASTVVRNTGLTALGENGRGISLQLYPDHGLPTMATIESSLVEDNHDNGLFVSGSTLTMTGSVVRGTLPVAKGLNGLGVSLQCQGPVPSSATIVDSVIAANSKFGLVIIGSQATIGGTTIRTTSAVTEQGQPIYGDGIVMVNEEVPASLAATDCHIVDNARAGILYHSGDLALGSTELDCNDIDLIDGSESGVAFNNLGGNTCGCPGGSQECKWFAASTAPPAPLPPTEGSGGG